MSKQDEDAERLMKVKEAASPTEAPPKKEKSKRKEREREKKKKAEEEEEEEAEEENKVRNPYCHAPEYYSGTCRDLIRSP